VMAVVVVVVEDAIAGAPPVLGSSGGSVVVSAVMDTGHVRVRVVGDHHEVGGLANVACPIPANLDSKPGAVDHVVSDVCLVAVRVDRYAVRGAFVDEVVGDNRASVVAPGRTTRSGAVVALG